MSKWDLSDLISDDGEDPAPKKKAEPVVPPPAKSKRGLVDLISDDEEEPVTPPAPAEDKWGLADLIDDEEDPPYIEPVWCGCWKDDCEACEAWLQSCLY